MRIACLQFAPQVGDIDNNLNRADSVLAKANPDDLEDLDLLVLPELAFTGYNFKSLNQISPFLEPQGSGISALWARTTALKYNTNVIVGYPERVDVSPKWPTGPEYYNSTLVINGDGETIANYRKSFLYVIDETWALEGKDGFFDGEIHGLGNVAMGICMDLNPYKFEAPWHTFEFAFHILAVEANLVIITMAWVTREDGRRFSRMPAEPDMETLTYWVQRLEPLIRAEDREEVIVVFCNRTGTEDDLVYAGTSSVIGIKDGEVNVYGILGRSVKDLLVVDTDNGPFAKLVQRSEEEKEPEPRVPETSRRPREATTAAVSSTTESTTSSSPKAKARQRKPSPAPILSTKPKKVRPQSPKIQIPDTSFYRRRSTTQGSPMEESPGVATPTCPSPTPLDQRPKLISPRPAAKTGKKHIDTPYPHDEPEEPQPQILGGRVYIDHESPSTVSSASSRIPDKYFWSTTQPPLRSPMESRFPHVYPTAASSAAVSPVASSLVNVHFREHRGTRSHSSSKRQSPTDDTEQSDQFSRHASGKEETSTSRPNDSRGEEVVPPRPSSPKSRNASRTGRHGDYRPSEFDQADLSGIGDRLEATSRRPGSAMDSRGNATEGMRHGRAHSRDARSDNRVSRFVGTSYISDEKHGNISGTDGSPMASPQALSDTIIRPQSDILKNRGPIHSRGRAGSGTSNSSAMARDIARTKSVMGQFSRHAHSRNGSNQPGHRDPEPHIEPDETRTLVWSELSKMVGEMIHQPGSREASRGRQQDANFVTTPHAQPVGRLAREESRGQIVPRNMEQRFSSRERRESTDQQPIRTILAPDGAKGSNSPGNPDDEIVAEIIFHSHGRPAHNQTNNATPGQRTTSKSPPSAHRASAPRQDAGNDLQAAVGQQKTTMHGRRQLYSPPTSTDGTHHSHDNFSEIKVYKAPTPSNIDSTVRPQSGDSCPNMDGASARTLTTPKGSPLTPSLRAFEPKTPKAMKLDLDYGVVLTSASDPVSGGEFPPLDALQGEALAAAAPPRAKSTAW